MPATLPADKPVRLDLEPLVVAVNKTDLLTIADRRRYSHEEPRVDLGVRNVGAGVLRSGLHGIADSVHPQREPVRQYSLQLGERPSAGVLDATYSGDRA